MGPFDPYYEWLGIRPDEHPISKYRLLGLAPFEDDPKLIRRAADRLRKFVGDQSSEKAAARRLIDELDEAGRTLLHPVRRDAYDRELRARRHGSSTPANESTAEFVAGGNSPPGGANFESEANDSTLALDAAELGRRIVAAGLMSPDEWQATREKMPASGGTDPAAALLEGGRLTAYQLARLTSVDPPRLVLGNYVILDRIGGGGMGEVFRARHRRMDRIVALKVLHERIAADPAARTRFEREVKAAAKLSHPHIVTAHDSDETDGIRFLVTEFVPGVDLAEWVKIHGPMTPEQAVGLMMQAAEGLEYAHRAGVIHRDVKPANLLLSADGTIKILDLGLARVAVGEVDSQDLTDTGQILGTIPFMAPEQAVHTKSADHRADIYSLGCTLYYLLAGKPPYSGRTKMEALLAHREQPIPSLMKLHPEVGPLLDAVFRKMSAKRREDRYESMAAVCFDLERCGFTSAARGTSVATPERVSVARPAAVLAEAFDSPVATSPPLPDSQSHIGSEFSGNSLGMIFMWCPPGRFLMGSPPDEAGRDTDEDQAEVEISRGFLLGKYTVKQMDWTALMGTQPWKGNPGGTEGIRRPATYVSWEDCRSFCDILTARERAGGRLSVGWKYRLPTEAEWEYACRAGSRGMYFAGEGVRDLQGWYAGNPPHLGLTYAQPVGMKEANAWGFHDMHGNVWEWCRDWYCEELSGGRDPRGAAKGLVRALRGGSWNSPAARCRAAQRFRHDPNTRFERFGFRVALVPAD